ncbi:uncharacterized protein LOC108100971 [Drosophila ficusphila]|uniref:uncharacterized protein LOC108100971 n=1 Tax=Drosophila ficusphila TaxID=30025 RepID=UPI0007E8743B|nr:uncharacterized protein LOC108100971 [Drosophila ficusphila]
MNVSLPFTRTKHGKRFTTQPIAKQFNQLTDRAGFGCLFLVCFLKSEILFRPNPMEKINEDIWVEILKFCPMRDQFSLIQLNENVKSYVKYHWGHLKSVTLSTGDLELLDKNEELMQEFLGSWSRTVQWLTLNRCSMDLLKKWTQFSFPHLRSLDCHMEYNLEEADEETLLLTVLFPHLTTLTLNSSTSGRHLWRWKQLKELNLIWCEYLDTDYFEEIFDRLKLTKLTLLYYGYNVILGDKVMAITRCTTLEELTIDDHHLLGGALQRLIDLPHFRRLSFYTRDYNEFLANSVAKHKPLKVRSLLFNDSFWSSERVTDDILKMTNLQRLVLQEDDIDTQQLHDICQKLPHLEELHLLQMRELPTSTRLWNTIGTCPSLRLLNLSSTKLGNWMDLSKSHLPKVLLNRTFPLTLHLHNTGFDPQKVIPALEHDNLKISFEPIHLNVWSSRFMEIEFNPELK